MLLKHAFDTTTEGIYLRTRSDGRLFNLARLRAKTKVRKVLIRDMLFADDTAVVTHTQEELQSMMDCFSQACKDFGLTISLKKTNALGQDTEAPPVITIDDYELDAVSQFTYLGSTIADNLSLDAEGSFNSRPSHSSSVVKPQAVCEDKDGSLQCLCYQHIVVWKRDIDYVCQVGEKAQLIPPEKHPPYPGNILAGQSNQCCCPVSCWSSHYVHPEQTMQITMVGSCLPYGGWSHSKRHPLR